MVTEEEHEGEVDEYITVQCLDWEDAIRRSLLQLLDNPSIVAYFRKFDRSGRGPYSNGETMGLCRYY